MVYYTQDSNIDECMILQNFGFLIPYPESDADPEETVYEKMAKMGKFLMTIGVTHVWWAPPYKTVGVNQRREGYAVADRYDLGEFYQQGMTRTKYGTRAQLQTALSSMHENNILNLCDLVPNQMFIEDQIVTQCTTCDGNGNATSGRFLYPAYALGGGAGQEAYGSVNQLTPWQFNGGSSQSIGMHSILTDANNIPYTWNKPGIQINVEYSGNMSNMLEYNYGVNLDTKTVVDSYGSYTIETASGDAIFYVNMSGTGQYGGAPVPDGKSYFYGYNLEAGGSFSCNIQLINGSYVPDWFIKKIVYWSLNGLTMETQTTKDMYGVNNYLLISQGFVQYVHFIPYAYYYTDPNEGSQISSFVDYLGENGFQTEEEVINNVGSGVGGAMSDWIALQPGYNAKTDSFGNFLFMKDAYITNSEICKVSTLQNLENIITDWDGTIYGMFGVYEESQQNSISVVAQDIITMMNSWYTAAVAKAQANQTSQSYPATESNGRGYNLDVDVNVLAQEFLLGLDVDNTNPIMQDDTVNWQKFLISNGFDGWRIDASMCFNTDILVQSAELMEETFGIDNMRKRYICINETYDNTASPAFQENHGYPQLLMDYVQNSGWSPIISPWGTSIDITYVELYNMSYTSRFRARRNGFPNWTYLTHHDSRQGTLDSLMPQEGDFLYDMGPWEQAVYAGKRFYSDLHNHNHSYSWTNYLMCYAVMLSNSATVPSVYFGDIWVETESYMMERSAYYGPLTLIMATRGRYCYGEYQMQAFLSSDSSHVGHHCFANVRFGLGRTTGMATLVNNNPTDQMTVKINMGLVHANQEFTNIFSSTKETVTTDNSGCFEVFTHGEISYRMYGHISIWVPTGA